MVLVEVKLTENKSWNKVASKNPDLSRMLIKERQRLQMALKKKKTFDAPILSFCPVHRGPMDSATIFQKTECSVDEDLMRADL